MCERGRQNMPGKEGKLGDTDTTETEKAHLRETGR